MTNDTERVSATIYEFPLRGRFAGLSDVNRFEQAAKAAVVDTNGWYHADAIKDDHARPH